VPVYPSSDKKTGRNLHSWAPLSCPLAAWSVHDFGFLQNKFPGVSIRSYFSPACNTNFHKVIFKFVRPSLHGFATDVFPSGLFLNTFITVLSSGILSTCRNCRNLSFLISEIMSGCLHRLVEPLRQLFSVLDQRVRKTLYKGPT
jgi:hypothetical protein